MEAKTTTPAKTVTTRRCNCGCGEATSSAKTQYKPGHDARHVGIVARLVAPNNLPADESNALLDSLGSEKLKTKALMMAHRLREKAAAKAPKADAQPVAQGQKRGAGARNQKAIAAKVAQEEAAHAATQAVPTPEWDDTDPGDLGDSIDPVRVGRWTYPARLIGTDRVERNTKRDGSGEWVVFTK